MTKRYYRCIVMCLSFAHIWTFCMEVCSTSRHCVTPFCCHRVTFTNTVHCNPIFLRPSPMFDAFVDIICHFWGVFHINLYPASLCDIPENSKSPCWFIKDLWGGPITFLLSFGYVLEWIKLFLSLSQSIWNLTFQCHTVTNGRELRKSPLGSRCLAVVG